MSLFQNRPQVSDNITYTTFGMNKTLLIVGLGNIGREYELTRHNIGFHIVDEFVRKNTEMDEWIVKKDLKCSVASGRFVDTRVYVIKPSTFMNLSGEGVQAVAHFYKISADQIVVVHDELDVTFGQIRLRTGGSSAGHNGIKSISAQIGDNYGRIRIGIGPKVPDQIEAADFVLQKFSAKEQEQFGNLSKEALAILSEFIYGGQQLTAETRSFIV
jgi:PTH1 family peptidyl-tRNA hydrolase